MENFNWREHANALKVKLNNGDNLYIEDQEHCALLFFNCSDGCIAGQYYFNTAFSDQIQIQIWDRTYPGPKTLFGKVLEYSFDYGKTWSKEDLGTLEERYAKAAAIIDRPVEYLKDIDADGPKCESSKPVCDCILGNCCWLTKCHFVEKWWEK